MTRLELTKQVMASTGVDRHTVSHVIDTMIDTIKSALAAGDNVCIRELGNFHVKLRRGKTGRDIGRGVSVAIPPHSVVAFKPSKELADSVYHINS